MDEIRAVFEVTTPMFMGGADNQQAELRIPSLLGALRFWYRATAPEYLINSVAELRQAEARLFGSSEKGQSAFITRLEAGRVINSKLNLDSEQETIWHDWGSGYLGYGCIGLKKRENGRGSLLRVGRNYIKEGSTFGVRFIMRPGLETDTRGLVRAIKALGLFGGLGSRSRRGFGSVTLISLTCGGDQQLPWQAPHSAAELKGEIESFLREEPVTNNLPPYTAFSRNSLVVITDQDHDSGRLLDRIGREMVKYRSYGHGDRPDRHQLPWGDTAQQNFKEDHDLVLQAAYGNQVNEPPRRMAFGLPHNYFFSSIGKKVDIVGEHYQRRGSPLLIHIQRLAVGYAAVLTYLPADFLPEGEMVVLGDRVKVAPVIDQNVIPTFIRSFQNHLEVRP